MNTKICINCRAKLRGPYCYVCGEKLVVKKDFTVKHLMEQTVDVFTHFDSKFFKTFKWLLVKPGSLTVAYIDGWRKPFMKPFQVFILVNIIFFLLFSEADIFRIPSIWFFPQDELHGFNIADIVARKMSQLDKTFNELATIYDQKSSTLAKGLVILFIPMFSLLFVALFYKKKLQIGKHIVFATHLFSFMLLALIFWIGVVRLLPDFGFSSMIVFVLPSFVIWSVYCSLAVKRFYETSWWFSIFSSLIVIATFILFTEIYRVGLSIYTLKML